MRPLALALFLLAALAFGQSPPNLLILGVVLEPGANQPVPDAEVWFFSQGPNENSGTAYTDQRGAFSFTVDKPGPYRVEARKEGYVAAALRSVRNSAELKLTPENPVADVKLYLGRPGRLTGSVVDEETHKPVAGLQLRAVVPPSWRPQADAKTDAAGEFVISNLPPGDYAVEAGPPRGLVGRVLTAFTQKDVDTVTRDFERALWPDAPLSLASGAAVHLGQFQIKKVPYYRVLVRVPESDCEPGDTMSIREYDNLQAPCGNVLVTGFAPGEYSLALSVDSGAATIPFAIADRNIEIMASLRPSVSVDGVVVAADGARLADLPALEIHLELANATSDSEGKFRFENLVPSDRRMFIRGFAPRHYVKEIRFNGVPLETDTLPLGQAAVSNTLTIVIDDKPATITGFVVSREQPVGGAFVIARKWPPKPDSFTSAVSGAKSDATGRFQLAGLAPGEYRVIAVRSATPGTPNSVIESVLAGGKKIEIGPNQLQTVTLEVTELTP